MIPEYRYGELWSEFTVILYGDGYIAAFTE